MIFTKITTDHFERLSDYTSDYVEHDVDGRLVLCAYNGDDCIGVYYVRAKIATCCPTFKGDVEAYIQSDYASALPRPMMCVS